MSGISAVSRIHNYEYGQFATGKKINKASDGAASLAIIQKQQTQINGYDVGSRNLKSAQGLAYISDGALSGISDYLGRIHELALQASGGFMSKSDLSAIQSEINQMKEGISQIASTTNYNGIALLDGSSIGVHVASGHGSMNVDISDMALKALGIEDFNVMGEFNIKDIEDAISKVNTQRSRIGAQTNALEYAYNYSTNASYNTNASQSRLEDLDYPKAISDQKKEETLREYSFFMQRKQMEQESRQKLFFT